MPAAASTKRATSTALLRRMAGHARELVAKFSDQPVSDAEVQATVCAAPILAAASGNIDDALAWLEPQLNPWEQRALHQAFSLQTEYSSPPAPSRPLSPSHLFELFLRKHSPSARKRHGVFFTPEPIAHYIITQIDRLLREEFHLHDGLAAQSAIRNPKSEIPLFLDPACGTGLFLLTLIDHLHRLVQHRRWNAFVPDLLSRLVGIEILPAAAFLCKLNLTLKLAETGYQFAQSANLRIFTGDALSPNLQSEICNPQSAIPVLLGNPPFSTLSTNTNPWIARLIRGDDEIRGYIRANGQQLGERKTWLHDDYVKFIRLAQWHVEQAGAGIVGFITNHGYLDNATFRLMRHELLRVFPHIQIVNLHGNRRACGAGVSPAVPTRRASEGIDENVFHLDQGIAIGLFCRGVGVSPAVLDHAELRGSRAFKLAALASGTVKTQPFSPHAPNWRFSSTPPIANHPEYNSAWSLADAMPVNTTAPVTARDHFVVAFTRDELAHRIEQFRDLSVTDDEIRQRYFTRTRSARYRTGDTRSWQLSTARRILAAEKNWQRHITCCLYRPFDWRYIFWHPAMIDWPRTEVTQHLIKGSGFRVQGSEVGETVLPEPRTLNPEPSLCLIARRQQLPSQPCTFFWISDGLALDGVIRSDNRGSESLFPLYIHEQASEANFAPAFVEQFASRLNLTWQPLGRGRPARSFGPEDLVAYTYALFHSPTYRERYADSLRTDFPRILPPRDLHQFAQLSYFGRELIDLHLLRNPQSAPVLRLDYQCNPQSSDAVASFRAGGYPALKKWLQPPHRSPADPDYAQITAAIARTLEIMPAIDAVFTDS